MTTNGSSGRSTWVDPDEPAKLTDQFFLDATLMQGDRVILRGRPPVPGIKHEVTLRLEAPVVEAMKREGVEWQSHVNEILRKALGVH